MFGPTLDSVSRGLFLALSRSAALKRWASRSGMRPEGFARRFIGGETLDEALETAHRLEQQGFTHTLNYLGEHVKSIDEADAATRAYLNILTRLSRARLGSYLSVKLTQLGIELDPAVSDRNIRRILDAARVTKAFVRIDMEQSALVPATLAVFERLTQDGYTHVGIVLQAALYRSEDDVRRMNELGARVRLVKGAYKEPGSIAFQKKKDVDAAFVRLMRQLLADGVQPAIATHDPAMIAATCAAAREQTRPPGFFEFQMLFGVRRDLQTSLRAQGLPLRVYVPFGHEWFPYFMRRLAERPANVAFVIRGILHEHVGHGHTFR